MGAYQNVTPDYGKYSAVLNCWGDQNYEHLAPPTRKCTGEERDKMAFGKREMCSWSAIFLS